ncbi:MAG: hypothetical protein GY928_10390 [Colwellia sp.]|nr:hypothetical protein [Colwellia sp.]
MIPIPMMIIMDMDMDMNMNMNITVTSMEIIIMDMDIENPRLGKTNGLSKTVLTQEPLLDLMDKVKVTFPPDLVVQTPVLMEVMEHIQEVLTRTKIVPGVILLLIVVTANAQKPGIINGTKLINQRPPLRHILMEKEPLKPELLPKAPKEKLKEQKDLDREPVSETKPPNGEANMVFREMGITNLPGMMITTTLTEMTPEDRP